VTTHSHAVVSVLCYPLLLAAVSCARRLKVAKTSGAVLEGIIAVVTKLIPMNN